MNTTQIDPVKLAKQFYKSAWISLQQPTWSEFNTPEAVHQYAVNMSINSDLTVDEILDDWIESGIKNYK